MKYWRRHLCPLVIITGVLVIIFRKFFFQGLLPIPYNILVGWYFPYNLGDWVGYTPGIPYKGGLFAADVFRQMIPWKRLSLELIGQGQLPLWNPHNFSGEPLLANIQVTVFYPLTLLFLVIPNFDVAWSWYIIASPLIAIVGMYYFLKSLHLTTWASLLGGLGFGLSGHMISWLEWGVVTHSAIWLPWLLFGFRRWIIHHNWWSLAVILLSAYATITGGYPQESAYVLLLAGAYCLFLLVTIPSQPRRSSLSLIVFMGLLVGFIASVQLLPTFQLYQASALKGDTSEQLFQRTQIHPWHLLTFFAPDFFGNRITQNYWAEVFTQVDYTDANLFIGSVATVLALYQLLHRSKDNNERFFRTVAIVSLLAALDWIGSDFIASLRLPMISTGVAAGSLFLTASAMSIVAAYGANRIITGGLSKRLAILPLIYGTLLLSTLLVPDEYQRTSLRNLVIPTATASATVVMLMFMSLAPAIITYFRVKRSQLRFLVLGLLLVLAGAEYGLYANKMLSFSDPSYSYPKHPLINELTKRAAWDRVIGFWNSEIATNLHTELNLYSSEGYNPLHSRRYQLLSAATKNHGQYTTKIARSDADVAVDNVAARNRFMQLTSTRYVAAKVTDPTKIWEVQPLKYDPSFFELVWQQGQYKIYQFPSALDRVLVFSSYEVIANEADRINRLYQPTFDPHQSLVLETEPHLPIDPQASGTATILDYQPNAVTIETDTSGGNSLLLLTDTYYPTWQASIDGQSVPIYIANQTFRAIVVPEGKHQIEFTINWI